MKIVILGAGASFDSVFRYKDKGISEPWKPPLCNELFDLREQFNPIIEKYKGVGSLRSEILTFTDIEAYFQNKWDFAINYHEQQLLNNLINIQYYLSEVFCKISTNYSNAGPSNIDVLVSKAQAYSVKKREDVVFITFNYDTLIEDSFLRVLNKRVSSMNDYINTNIKLIKCHGSCNWFQNLNPQMISYDSRNMRSTPIYDYLYDKKLSLKEIESSLEGRIFLYNNISDFLYMQKRVFVTRYTYYPQLLIPLKTKDDFVLPEKHKQYLKECMKNVDDILIVGWKGNEAFFNKQLSNSLGNKTVAITVVNATDKRIKEQLSSFKINATYNFYENMNAMQSYLRGSFSQYIQDVNQNKFEDFFN